MIKQQSLSTKIVRIDLQNKGNGNNVFGMTVFDASDFDNAGFKVFVKDPNNDGWKLNDEFQNALEDIFLIIKKKIAGNKQ